MPNFAPNFLIKLLAVLRFVVGGGASWTAVIVLAAIERCVGSASERTDPDEMPSLQIGF